MSLVRLISMSVVLLAALILGVVSPLPAADREGPSSEVLTAARRAVDCAVQRGDLSATDLLTVIDYRLPSTEPRLWVIDGEARILFAERVAHGQNTGDNLASTFSDTSGSHQSSLGLFVTAETYRGKHGYSLRLDGLEPGYNGRARDRAIVMHGADYATQDFIDRHGRLGRSWGCPAVRPDVSRSLIDAIQGGTPLFAYYDDDAWLRGSELLQCD